MRLNLAHSTWHTARSTFRMQVGVREGVRGTSTVHVDQKLLPHSHTIMRGVEDAI